MAIEAVKIPTNIQVEERIIGPLSLRQIAIMLLSGGFSYVIWTAVTKSNPSANILLQVFCWIPLMVGTAFSFVQVNGVSLFTLVLLWVERIDKPSIRTFGPRTGLSINIKTSTVEPEKEAPKQTRSTTDFAALGTVLDAGLTKEAESNKPLEHSRILDAIQSPESTSMAAQPVELKEEESDELETEKDDSFTIFRDIQA